MVRITAAVLRHRAARSLSQASEIAAAGALVPARAVDTTIMKASSMSSRAGSLGARLFIVYAVASLIPVLALGLVMVRSEASSGTERGLAQGRAQAAVIVQMAIAPALSRRNLSQGLTADE